MMVPRWHLIGWVAAIGLPASILAALQPGLTLLSSLALLGLLAVAVMDAWMSRHRMAGFTVQAPEVVRMTVDRSARIPLTLTKPAALATALRLGLALPSLMESDQVDLRIALAVGEDRIVLPWACRPLQRGCYALTRCHLEMVSRCGLWAMRRQFDLNGEVRAYPNLMAGQHSLRGLFRRREWGLRTQRRVGKGREFEQLRDYLPGDSFEDIDWKATARRRHPITRVFQVEQAQEIYVVLDASRLSTRSASYVIDRRRRTRSQEALPAVTIFERYITAALTMAVVADQLADRFGMLIFSDKPDGFIQAGRGKAHYNACRDALYHRMPRAVSPDFEELFTFVGTRLRKRALLVFLTSLDDPVLADGFIRTMRAAARQHVVMVNMFRPPGAHPLFASATIKEPQGIYQHLVGHMLWASLSETKKRLKQHGAGFHLLEQTQLCSQLVSQYMEVKQRQLL
jgi:uncharacterized protein (DUF58 family)